MNRRGFIGLLLAVVVWLRPRATLAHGHPKREYVDLEKLTLSIIADAKAMCDKQLAAVQWGDDDPEIVKENEMNKRAGELAWKISDWNKYVDGK